MTLGYLDGSIRHWVKNLSKEWIQIDVHWCKIEPAPLFSYRPFQFERFF
jgi:hypothetical protein